MAKDMSAIGAQILACDDDVITLGIMREALQQVTQCRVETTTSPEYAFELVLKKQYDLLIFDLVMPNIDGATLYSLILKVYEVLLPPEHVIPPLVLVTGNAGSPRAKELARLPGVRAVLAKPFRLGQLIQTVETALALKA